jgi:hypothetical protein
MVGPPTFSFHKEYVQDISDIIKEEKDQKKLMQKVMKKVAPRKHRKEPTGWSMRTLPRFQVGYILPPASQQGDKRPPSLGYRMVRSIVLGAFNDFLYLQEVENAKTKESR